MKAPDSVQAQGPIDDCQNLASKQFLLSVATVSKGRLPLRASVARPITYHVFSVGLRAAIATYLQYLCSLYNHPPR